MKSTNPTNADQVQSAKMSRREHLEAFLAPPPALSNTGGQTSLSSVEAVESPIPEDPNPSPEESQPGGVDYLEVSFYGGWDREKFTELASKLDALKEETQEYRKVHGKGYGLFECPEGEILWVEPFGVTGGCPCRWSMKLAGSISISIVDRAEYVEGRPSVRVSIPSAPCMAEGEERVLERVNAILASLGFVHVQPIGISRVDVCVDLPDVDTDRLVRSFMQGRRIKLAGKSQTFEVGNRMTGFVCGSGDMVKLRVYDKELETRNDAEKREIMRVRRWNGVIPEHATRVEFQLRRKWLNKHFDIKTLDDWKEKRAEVVAYLTERWFRLTREIVDSANNNQARATVSPLWERVQKLFADVVGRSAAAFLKPIKRPPKASEPLVVQALGCLSSAIALGVDPDEEPNEPALLRALHEYFAPKLADFAKQVQDKAKAYRVTKTLPPPLSFADIPF